ATFPRQRREPPSRCRSASTTPTSYFHTFRWCQSLTRSPRRWSWQRKARNARAGGRAPLVRRAHASRAERVERPKQVVRSERKNRMKWAITGLTVLGIAAAACAAMLVAALRAGSLMPLHKNTGDDAEIQVLYAKEALEPM